MLQSFWTGGKHFEVTVDGESFTNVGARTSSQWSVFVLMVARKPTKVELLDVKRKLEPEQVAQIACIAGDSLRVTSFPQQLNKPESRSTSWDASTNTRATP